MLNKINSPEDLKKLNIDELNFLADQIRETLIKRVTITGGHMGSNLGFIEATIALHYVFNSPVDKFVFDVSHQTYTHKILTGRKDAFIDENKYYSVSGYTTPSESVHDFFKVGHTSTSISLACGLAKARDLNGQKENIVAIIGDGSLSGGEAYEGLNNAAMLNSNFIILVNDNEMSIAPNFGGLYKNLEELRNTNGTTQNNFFKTLGFEYYYVKEGNNIQKLVEIFNKVKDINHPVVVHINTLKGKGLSWAMEDKEAGHWANPISNKSQSINETYESITSKFLLDAIKDDPSVIAISPATPKASGLTKDFRIQANNQFIDVGICEEHAIAFASGLAKNNANPFLLISSSFIQRTYDQLNQDLAMNNNPATILIFNGRVSGGDCTHVGQYDIAMISNIPNLVCLAPTNKNEYLDILEYAKENKNHPLIIRVPKNPVLTEEKSSFDKENIFKYTTIHKGHKIAIIGLGNFYHLGKELHKALINQGYNPTLINPICYSHIDKDLLESLKENHDLVITLEDGCVEGGFGYKLASYFGNSDVKVLNYGGQKDFNDLISLKDLYEKCRLNIDQIICDIKLNI